MERRLKILITAVTIIIGLSATAIVIAMSHGGNEETIRNYEVCLSPGCVQAAATVLKYVDPKVDPCDDFYQFACGTFLKRVIIPDDESSAGVFTDTSNTVRNQLRPIIEEPIHSTDIKGVQIVKRIYEACMNTSEIENTGLTYVKRVLRDAGGWPLLEDSNWKENEFIWSKSVAKLIENGFVISYLIPVSVLPDLKDPERKAVYVSQPTFHLEREFMIQGFSSKWVRNYYEYMVDVAVLYGADRKQAAYELKESLNFEIELAKITIPKEKFRNISTLYNPMTVSEMQGKFPSVQWLEYVNGVLGSEARINNDYVIIVAVPQFLSALEVLINRTSKRVQANYIMWRTIQASIPYLTEALRIREFKYNTLLTGATERKTRWKECINTPVAFLPSVLKLLYLSKYYDERARTQSLDILENIRAEFEEILQNVSWMDKETRENALKKFKLMTSDVPHPDIVKDIKAINNHYSKYKYPNESSYLGLVLSMVTFVKNDLTASLKTTNKTLIVSDRLPYFVNAFYKNSKNDMELRPGILQGLFFDIHRPNYMNYASIGFVFGHEITHGFDDVGRQFDKKGSLSSWWTPETEKAYLTKVQCIIEQYGNYTIPNLNIALNGINTQGENIADNGGIKESYLAYNKWWKQHGVEKSLPGLPYTPNQLFWISAATIWCEKVRPEVLIHSFADSHVPKYFRVVGPLRNSEYFSKDFECALGSKMNPVNKCNVW